MTPMQRRSAWAVSASQQGHGRVGAGAAVVERSGQQLHTGNGEPTGSTAATVSGQEQGSFKWTKQWYPLMVMSYLRPERPTPLKLLGKELVAWRDVDGQWRVMDDTCPHRLAPLSEGRIEPSDGTLQCSYHGWRFNGEGRCTAIPQSADEDMQRRAMDNPKSWVKQYPVQVKQHLLWVWPEAGTDALLESSSKQPALIPALEKDEDVIYISKWFMREVCMSWDVLFENVLDPSHVPFSHHGVLSDREKVTVMDMEIVEGLQRDTGFAVRSTTRGVPHAPVDSGELKKKKPTIINFKPPSLAEYKMGAMGLNMITYSTPTEPGRSKIFYAMVRTARWHESDSLLSLATAKVADRASAPKALKMVEKKPAFLEYRDHFKRNDVLDGDMCFLHAQDRKLERINRDWHQYMLPTQMDTAVLGFRRWYAQMAGPVSYDPASSRAGLTNELTRAQMLDRFHQHTQHCPTCMTAMQRFIWLQRGAAAAVAVCALLAAAAWGAGMRLLDPRFIALTAMAALGGLVWQKAGQTVQRFKFVDYVHAER